MGMENEMSDSCEFENIILGKYFKNSRLKELQSKSSKKGLRGDEVFEFIYLDRQELISTHKDQVKLLESRNKTQEKLLLYLQENHYEAWLDSAVNLNN